MKIRKLYFYYICGASLILALIYFYLSFYNNSIPMYQYQIGQITQEAIKAPFSYTIFKPEPILNHEVNERLNILLPIFKISEDVKFNLQKKIDYLFLEFNNAFESSDTLNFKNRLSKNGFDLNQNTLNYLKNQKNRLFVYSLFTEQISLIMRYGIYDERLTYPEIRINDKNQIKVYKKTDLLSVDEAKRRILRSIDVSTLKNVADDLLNSILEANLELDQVSTEKEKNDIRKSIDPVLGKVEKNEYIVVKNHRITNTDIIKIESLVKAYKEKNLQRDYPTLILSSLGQFLFCLLLLSVFYTFSMIFFSKQFEALNYFLFSLSCFVFSVIISVVVFYSFDTKVISVIPFPLIILVVSLIYAGNYGLLFAVMDIFLVGQFLNWNMYYLINLFFASVFGILAIKRSNQVNYFIIFIYMLLGFTTSLIAMTLYRNEGLPLFSKNLFFGTVSIILSIIGSILFAPFIDRKLNFSSKQTLLELLDFNKPLLKQLAKEAPGTYYHSLVVGNLAEATAEAIGANPLIARVGSYYHDIGKLTEPSIFIENNVDSVNIHKNLAPTESSTRIRDHVLNGIQLAKQHKLPKVIQDIIIQHHGDSKIRFFLHKALEQGLIIDENSFMYTGPRPQTKEAVLVMIADIVESTAKSLKEYNSVTINKIVNDTILKLLEDHQLDDAPITMRDLNIVKSTMIPILESVYRKRIEYPEDKK